jgi:hypothetical protein
VPSGKEGLADVRIIQALLESQDKKRPMRIAAVDSVPLRCFDNHLQAVFLLIEWG